MRVIQTTIRHLDDERATAPVTPVGLLRVASTAYVGAWIVGLALKPAGVTSADAEAAIAASYRDTRVSSLAQVLLVHGVAAVAALLLAGALAQVAVSWGRPTIGRASRWAGRTILTLSLVQAILGALMIGGAGRAAASTTRGLLVGVERLDAAKLVALAALCTVGIRLGRAGLATRGSVRIAGAAISCLLVAAVALSGVAPALAPMAAPALLLLLVWVGLLPSALRRAGAVS